MYRKAYTNVTKAEFTQAVVQFHKQGGALFVWGGIFYVIINILCIRFHTPLTFAFLMVDPFLFLDNDPLFEHANAVLPELLKVYLFPLLYRYPSLRLK